MFYPELHMIGSCSLRFWFEWYLVRDHRMYRCPYPRHSALHALTFFLTLNHYLNFYL